MDPFERGVLVGMALLALELAIGGALPLAVAQIASVLLVTATRH